MIIARCACCRPGTVALTEAIVKEKALNILPIMAAVLLITSLVFRSLLGGLLILVPVVAAVLVNFGVMGLTGIPLMIATALVSAMAVGSGADCGIYLCYRMREELRKGGDERGTVNLTVENCELGRDDDWIYVPALKKVRRLVSSNKRDSFVGTDFSYGDVIGQKVEQWIHKILREEKADGFDCWVIESVHLEAQNVQENRRTVIEFDKYEVNQGVPEDAFTARALERES